MSSPPTIERRRSDRRRACLGGSLRVAAFLPDVACRLRDHSLSGARIVVDEEAILPRVVDLTVTCREQTRRAEIVWRSGDQAGLAFRDGGEVSPSTASDAQVEGAWAAEAVLGQLH